MATKKITKRSVEDMALPLLGKRSLMWDDTLKGFGVRATSGGVRSYIVQYRIGGREAPTRTYTIGQHGNPWTAENARQHAKDILEMVRRGIDPVDDAREAVKRKSNEAEAKRAREFSAYAEQFLEKRVTARKLRRENEIRGIFTRDLIPYFRSRPIDEISKSDISNCLETVGKRSQSSANKAHRWLRHMFNWAASRDDVPKSPVEQIKQPYDENARERVLNDSELLRVWNAADLLGYPFGPIVRMLIATGQRLREVAAMEWTEVKLESAEWIIPGSRSKNKKEHTVPLNTIAIEALKYVATISGEGRYAFTTTGDTPVSGFSRAKRRLDDLLNGVPLSAPIPAWTLHDLRRTVATGCQRLGVPIEHTEALLNHLGTRGGIVGVYQRYQYGPEKTKAAQAWGKHLKNLSAHSVDRNAVLDTSFKAS
jgi:integrase